MPTNGQFAQWVSSHCEYQIKKHIRAYHLGIGAAYLVQTQDNKKASALLTAANNQANIAMRL